MDELLVAEFRGLFWGEGCADIQRYGKKGHAHPYYRPRLRISMKNNEVEMLRVIQENFGGHLAHHKKYEYPDRTTQPFTTWQLTNRDQLVHICDLLLDGHLLPAQKVQQVVLVREACIVGGHKNHKIGDDGRALMESYYQQLHSLKHN